MANHDQGIFVIPSGQVGQFVGAGMTHRISMTNQGIESIGRWRGACLVVVAATAALTALIATSATDATARGARPARHAHISEAAAPREAGEPLMAIVSIKSQQVTIYDADG